MATGVKRARALWTVEGFDFDNVSLIKWDAGGGNNFCPLQVVHDDGTLLWQHGPQEDSEAVPKTSPLLVAKGAKVVLTWNDGTTEESSSAIQKGCKVMQFELDKDISRCWRWRLRDATQHVIAAANDGCKR